MICRDVKTRSNAIRLGPTHLTASGVHLTNDNGPGGLTGLSVVSPTKNLREVRRSLAYFVMGEVPVQPSGEG